MITYSPDERLNLDVTAMIAYVSSLTNGGSNFKFKEPLLTQQAEWERERPAKPLLDKAFKGMVATRKLCTFPINCSSCMSDQ